MRCWCTSVTSLRSSARGELLRIRNPNPPAQNKHTRHNTTQHNTTQHNTTQHNTTQHNTTQHNTTQHNTTQHNTTQHKTTQHNTTQHNTPHHTTPHHTTPHHNTTQHNTTQHNTTQHNTTQHNTTQNKHTHTHTHTLYPPTIVSGLADFNALQTTVPGQVPETKPYTVCSHCDILGIPNLERPQRIQDAVGRRPQPKLSTFPELSTPFGSETGAALFGGYLAARNPSLCLRALEVTINFKVLGEL